MHSNFLASITSRFWQNTPPPTLDWAALPLPALSGGDIPADSLRGKVVLVVNTASHCGFTPQLAELETLWQAKRAKGLVVLGVPCNDFGGQEPADNPEVASFCQKSYGVDFPLLSKQSIIGPNAHPFYRWAAQRLGPLGLPRWNFHKVLIGRDGRLLDWFSSFTKPSAPRLRAAIDRALVH